jgi:hypothetical protein
MALDSGSSHLNNVRSRIAQAHIHKSVAVATCHTRAYEGLTTIMCHHRTRLAAVSSVAASHTGKTRRFDAQPTIGRVLLPNAVIGCW